MYQIISFAFYLILSSSLLFVSLRFDTGLCCSCITWIHLWWPITGSCQLHQWFLSNTGDWYLIPWCSLLRQKYTCFLFAYSATVLPSGRCMVGDVESFRLYKGRKEVALSSPMPKIKTNKGTIPLGPVNVNFFFQSLLFLSFRLSSYTVRIRMVVPYWVDSRLPHKPTMMTLMLEPQWKWLWNLNRSWRVSPNI